MATTGLSAVNQQLLTVAERLVVEYDDVAAGSVLRCFARAAFRARRSGCSAGDLAQRAEALTRQTLAARAPLGIAS
jgi:hypothetical protein